MYFVVYACSAATNIFIRGEEQGQLANEIRILWGQNQALKEQLSMGSKGQTRAWMISNKLFQLNVDKVQNFNAHFFEFPLDKQKENERLRETVARRSAKLEQSRKECEALRQENRQLQERLEESSQETTQLQETLQFSKDELHRYTRAHTHSHHHSTPGNMKPHTATNDNSKEPLQLPLFHPISASQKHDSRQL